MSTKKIKEEPVSQKGDIKEEYVNMNFRVSKTLHRKIKRIALDKDTTVTAVVMEALNTYADSQS